MRKGRKNSIAKIGYDVVSFAEPITRDNAPLTESASIIAERQQQLLDLLAGRPIRGPPALLTTEEVAELLRLSVSILNKWRLAGRGPQFVKVGTRVRYRLEDVAIFIAASTRGSTSATGPPLSP
jgi:excisionase family DNA binding protein